MKNRIRTHYIISFARDWGWKMCTVTDADSDIMMHCFDEEFDDLICAWVDEFLSSDDVDSGAFFDEHLEEWLHKERDLL